jgi:hypothetical protein
MPDTDDSLDIALRLIRRDLEMIQGAVSLENRIMNQGESMAVGRYVGALLDTQKSEIAALMAARQAAEKTSPAEMLEKLGRLPIVQDARRGVNGAPAQAKKRHRTED